MVFQRPLVMPMVNMMKNEYRPVFSTTTPCSARYLVTMDAGMPVSAKSPSKSRPGVTMVDLMGSSMLKPSARSPKPCQLSNSLPVFLALVLVEASLPRMTQSSARPTPSSAIFSGPQTSNHQSSSPNSSSTLRMARRKSSASRMDSSTSAVPPGGSIMAAATSQLAMMLYCGLVEVCIRYASLNRWRSSLVVWLSCTSTLLAWLMPASSLWMDCVAYTTDCLGRARLLPMAW